MIEVDHLSPVPPYEQVRTQLLRQIESGELPTGTRLPTVRRLADDLGLAVNTVARAYRELESAGFVETRGRAGTLVRSGDAALQTVSAAARTYADIVRATGIHPDDALDLVRTALDSVNR